MDKPHGSDSAWIGSHFSFSPSGFEGGVDTKNRRIWLSGDIYVGIRAAMYQRTHAFTRVITLTRRDRYESYR